MSVPRGMVLIVVVLCTDLSSPYVEVHAAQRAGAAEVAELFVRAWNAHTPAVLGGSLAADADWVTARGARLKGREDILSYFAREHSTWAKATSMTASRIMSRAVCERTVVVTFEWEITQAAGGSGGGGATFRGVTLFVVSEGGSGWVIVSGQIASQPATASAA